MGVAADIVRSLRRGPAPVLREHLARGPNEARAFAFLLLGCLLVLIAQGPRHARAVELNGDDFSRLVAYDFLAWMVIWPLVFYGLAALVHIASHAMGGRGELWAARLALFWSWLSAAPLALVAGAAGGFLGPRAADLAGVVWIAVFSLFWFVSQREAARGPVADGL